MPDVAPAERVRIRNRSLNAWLAVTSICPAFFGFALAVSVPNAVGVASGLIIVVASMYFAYRSWVAELLLDNTGVTIKNVVKTRHWSWDQVGEFGWDQPTWNIRGAHVRCVSVCPIGDRYTYPASTTACGLSDREKERFAKYEAALVPWTSGRGVGLHVTDNEPSVSRWHLDPRAKGP